MILERLELSLEGTFGEAAELVRGGLAGFASLASGFSCSAGSGAAVLESERGGGGFFGGNG